MKVQIISVYDCVAQVFSPPFYQNNVQTAIRGFRAGIRQEKSNEVSPQDLSLYRLGEFDDNTGAIVPLSEPEKIYTGFEAMQERVEVKEDA
jgi:hypothetical protein